MSKADWDDVDVNHVRMVSWLTLRTVSASITKGFNKGIWTTHFISGWLRAYFPAECDRMHGAAIACGDMVSEQHVFLGAPGCRFETVECFDVSMVSLDRITPPEGTKFLPHQADCNALTLEKGKYHLIVGSHGIHHIANLERLFPEMRKALVPQGLLYLYEWIGPEYLQIPRANAFVSRVLLHGLFPFTRTRTTHMGKTKGFGYIQDAPATFDPTEACNSTKLYPELCRNFLVLQEHNHGGLAYPMFEGLAQNLDESRAFTRWRIRVALAIERTLTRLGVIQPLFTLCVARPKPC